MALKSISICETLVSSNTSGWELSNSGSAYAANPPSAAEVLQH